MATDSVGISGILQYVEWAMWMYNHRNKNYLWEPNTDIVSEKGYALCLIRRIIEDFLYFWEVSDWFRVYKFQEPLCETVESSEARVVRNIIQIILDLIISLY